MREPYTPEKVVKVQSFFECQPCIERVYFASRPPQSDNFGRVTVVLDEWRTQGFRRRLNLADMHSKAFKQQPVPRDRPWLRVNARPVAEVVFHRSARYQTPDFPWREVVAKLGRKAVFVGSEAEHAEFVGVYGHVPHYPTPTLLDLAEVIAGAEFYVGNQSAPLWIRLGLCLPLYCEQNRRHDNCHFERSNAFYGPGDLSKVLQHVARFGFNAGSYRPSAHLCWAGVLRKEC